MKAYIKLTGIGIISLVFVLSFIIIMQPQSVQAGGTPCDGYDWMLPINLNNSLGETNFETDISINLSYLRAEGYLLSATCNDLEVQNESGDRLEHYKGLCKTDAGDVNTTITVLIPSFNQTGYVCLGKSGASDQSSITNTFPIFSDDMSVAWDKTEGTATSIDFSAGYMYVHDMSASANCIANKSFSSAISTNFIWQSELYMFNSSAEGGSRVLSITEGASSYSVHNAWDSAGTNYVMHDGTAYRDTSYDLVAQKWVTVSRYVYFSNDTETLVVDDTNYYDDTFREHGGEVDSIAGFFIHSGTAGKAAYRIDNIRARSLSNIPPIITYTGNLTAGPGGADATPPTITVVSPTNTSYGTYPIDINVTLNEAGDICLYNLDSGTNYTLSNSTTTNWYIENQTAITNSSTVQLFVWCNDTTGNLALNDTVWFTYENQTTEDGVYTCDNWITITDTWEEENVSMSYNEVNETRLIRLNMSDETDIEQIEVGFYLYQVGDGSKVMEPWACLDSDEDGVCDSDRQWGTNITSVVGSGYSDALNYTSSFTGSLINDTWATYILVGGYCSDCDGSNYIQGNAIVNNIEEIAYFGTWSKTTLDFSGGLWTTNSYAPMYRARVCSIGPDETPPTITIVSPTNTSYDTLPIDINITGSENLDDCVFSLDGGSNTTMSNSSATEFYSQTNSSLVLDHTYQLTVQCNDSAGNWGINNTIWFTYTIPDTPVITIYTPSNTTITNTLAKQLAFAGNFTPVTCIYAINGEANTTISCTTNTTWIHLVNNTQYYVTVYANDSNDIWTENTIYYKANVNEYGYVFMSDGQPQSGFSSGEDGWFVNASIHDDPAMGTGDYASRRANFYLGDIVNAGIEADFDTYYNNLVGQAGTEGNWIAFAGNHDHVAGDYSNFISKINNTWNDTLVWGNLMFVYVGNTGGEFYGIINDSLKVWFNETICGNYQNYNIVVLTHQTIWDTDYSSTDNPHANRELQDSAGNVTWVDDIYSQGCQISMWLHGHVAFDGNATADPDGHNQVENVSRYATWFINTLSIRDTYSNWTEYRWMSFIDGSNTAILRTREPVSSEWNEDLTYEITLDIAFDEDYTGADSTLPEITIVNPTSGSTQTATPINLNVTVNEAADSCWYHACSPLSCGANTTMSSSSQTNWFYQASWSNSSREEAAQFFVYCNDTTGNENYTSVTFTTDRDPPTFNWTLSNGTESDNVTTFNWRVNVSEFVGAYCKFEINGTNHTGTIFDLAGFSYCTYQETSLITNVTHCATFHADDLAGNVNSTDDEICRSTSIMYETMTVTIASPLSGSYSTPTHTLSVTTDVSADTCQYMIGPTATNVTMTGSGTVWSSSITVPSGTSTVWVWCQNGSMWDDSSISLGYYTGGGGGGGGGDTAECYLNSDCPVGHECINNICEDIVPECRTDVDCIGDRHCNTYGYCVTDLPPPTIDPLRDLTESINELLSGDHTEGLSHKIYLSEYFGFPFILLPILIICVFIYIFYLQSKDRIFKKKNRRF